MGPPGTSGNLHRWGKICREPPESRPAEVSERPDSGVSQQLRTPHAARSWKDLRAGGVIQGDGVVVQQTGGEVGEEDGVVISRVFETDRFVCGRRSAHLRSGVGDALKGSDGCCGGGLGGGGKCDGGGDV